MEDGTARAAGDLELQIGRLVDNYVMAVTERLCSLESHNPRVMGQSGFVEKRARILAGLDALDELVAGLRVSGARAGGPCSKPENRPEREAR